VTFHRVGKDSKASVEEKRQDLLSGLNPIAVVALRRLFA